MGRSIAGYYKALRFMLPAVCLMFLGDSCVQLMFGVFIFLSILSRVNHVGLFVELEIDSVDGLSNCVSEALFRTKTWILSALFGSKRRGGLWRSSAGGAIGSEEVIARTPCAALSYLSARP